MNASEFQQQSKPCRQLSSKSLAGYFYYCQSHDPVECTNKYVIFVRFLAIPRMREFFKMRRWVRSLVLCAIAALILFRNAAAQDLAPRAYVITPTHSNAVVISESFFTGDLAFDGTVPITDATAKANVPNLSLYHCLALFGRTASLTAVLPYGAGNFRGQALGTETNVYRSGLLDSAYRVSINIIGGPAMNAPQFLQWSQKTIIGASLRVITPTGQYDSTKLINWGSNRWGFKPELALSRRRGHWIIDAYGAGWFYTENPRFFSQNQYNPGISRQKQAPIAAFEGHVSYDFRPRFWASVDGNFWSGGRTSLNGVENPATEQRSSRIGGTVSVPVSKHQSFKFSYSNGAYVKFGGSFQNISMAWQYSWLGRPN